MELTKQDNQMAKGIAILGMVMLHLFCRLGPLPYTPLIWIGSTPLIYFLGLFGDLCVPIYCFCSGYAQALLYDKDGAEYCRNRWIRLSRFILHYWVVLIIFSAVGLIADPTGDIPGSLNKFLGNLFLYRMSYNGAWWFVLTYVLLVLLSPFTVKIVKQAPTIVTFLVSGMLYFGAYLMRFPLAVEISNPALSWIWNQILLWGTSQFSFVIGLIVYENRIVTQLRRFCRSLRIRNFIYTIVPILMFLLHTLVPSLIIAPITGLMTMMCFQVAEKPKWIENIFLFLGKHSTNIWLVHMFFYLVLFKGLVFIAVYPGLILAFMLALCLTASYMINFTKDIVLDICEIGIQRIMQRN